MLKVISLSLFLFILSFSAESFSENSQIPELSTSATASMSYPADKFILSFSVVTEHPQASSALGENSNKMKKVIDAVKSLGFQSDEYQTGNFSISPRYETSKLGYGTGKLQDYQVTNNLIISSKKLDSIAKVIDTAISSGANRFDYLSFDLSDKRAKRKELINEATKNAIEDAKFLSESSGVKLKKIKNIEVSNASGESISFKRSRNDLASAEFSSGVPIEAGSVTIRATVSLSYEIE